MNFTQTIFNPKNGRYISHHQDGRGWRLATDEEIAAFLALRESETTTEAQKRPPVYQQLWLLREMM